MSNKKNEKKGHLLKDYGIEDEKPWGESFFNNKIFALESFGPKLKTGSASVYLNKPDLLL